MTAREKAVLKLRIHDYKVKQLREAQAELNQAIREYSQETGHIVGMTADTFRRTVQAEQERLAAKAANANTYVPSLT